MAPLLDSFPILRQVLGWLTAGSPEYKVVDKMLETKNLYIFPEGIAGIFQTKPGTHKIIYKERRGLIKLAFTHGATICPIYSFGVNDSFQQTATGDGWLAKW